MSSSHPVTAVGTYVAVFVALLIGTALTVYVAYFDFGFLNTAIALGVAVAKASLVVWFFMGLRSEGAAFRILFGLSLVLVLLILGATFLDLVYR